MFLKVATIIAIIGVTLHLILVLFQQMLFAYRPFGNTTFTMTRLISSADILLFTISLLVFFIAFLLGLKGKSS